MTLPEIPSDLSTLSDEDLSALHDELRTYFDQAYEEAGPEFSDEALAELSTVQEALASIASEVGTRDEAAAARRAKADELAEKVKATAKDDGDDGEDEQAEGDGSEGGESDEGKESEDGDDANKAGEAEGEPEGEDVEKIAAAAASKAVTKLASTLERAMGKAAKAKDDGEADARPDLARMAAHRPVRQAPQNDKPVPFNIVASASAHGRRQGEDLGDLAGVAEAMVKTWDGWGRAAVGQPEDVILASLVANVPAERDLRGNMSDGEKRERIAAVTSLEAIAAAGGTCVPTTPRYEQLVVAGSQRPVRDSLPSFVDERGGIRILPPPQASSVADVPRSVADGATNTNTTVTSATAAFTAADVGAPISGTGIPAGAFIVAVGSATSVTISAAATATATGVTITITRLGAIGVISAAEDAAALGGTAAQVVAGSKPCIHVACPSPVEYLLDAISRCLEFGNFTTRAFPEQVEAWLAMALSKWAERSEVALLDKMSAASTQVTSPKVLGAARDLLGNWIKAVAYLRDRHRIDEDLRLRVIAPLWARDLMVTDLIRGSGGDAEYIREARAVIDAGLAEVNATPTWTVDSGTGKGQHFNSGLVQGAGALTGYPTTVVATIFPEGSFLFLDGGQLDLGVVRDSGLNALNNYRMFAETFEGLAFQGVEALELTSTVVADGTHAGPAYGSTTVSSPVALPTAF